MLSFVLFHPRYFSTDDKRGLFVRKSSLAKAPRVPPTEILQHSSSSSTPPSAHTNLEKELIQQVSMTLLEITNSYRNFIQSFMINLLRLKTYVAIQCAFDYMSIRLHQSKWGIVVLSLPEGSIYHVPSKWRRWFFEPVLYIRKNTIYKEMYSLSVQNTVVAQFLTLPSIRTLFMFYAI